MDSDKYCFFKIVVPCTSWPTLIHCPVAASCACACMCVSALNKDALCTSLPPPPKDAEAPCDVICAREFRATKKYKAKS